MIRCGMCNQPYADPWTVTVWRAHRKVCPVSPIGKLIADARERRRREHPMPEEVKAMLRERAAQRKGR